MDKFAQVTSAAKDAAHPTAEQARTSNYKKGRVELFGLKIAIETMAGQRRVGKTDGQPWSVICMAHYGDLSGTRGADGDPIDVFIGPWPESERIYVINRSGPKGGFDEHKVMLGFPDMASAVSAYKNSYERGHDGLSSVVPCSIDQLKWWIKYGDHAVPLTAKSLPHDGSVDMNETAWDANAQPVGTDLPSLMYRLRREDSGSGLLLDSVTINDILEDSDGELALDALVIPFNRLERKMTQMQLAMKVAGETVKPTAMQVTPPFKQRGTTNVAVIYELSDGQTLSVYFHNPDTTPNKLTPDDEMVSWKWLLNKKDVTILVAPERGRDLNPREVARRIMRLAEKNSARFQAANTKRAERMAAIETMKSGLDAKVAQLDELTKEIEVLEAKVAEKKTAPDPAAVVVPGNAAVTAAATLQGEGRDVTGEAVTGANTVAAKGETVVQAQGTASGFDGRAGDVMEELAKLGWNARRGALTASKEFNGSVYGIRANYTIKNDKYTALSFEDSGGGSTRVEDDLSLSPAQVAAIVDTEMRDSIRRARVEAYGVTSPEGYSIVSTDEDLQVEYQDQLDSFFQGRIVAVRNAMRELDWFGPEKVMTKGDYRFTFDVASVGAGANVVGVKYQILDAKEVEVMGLVDDLRMKPEEIADSLDKAVSAGTDAGVALAIYRDGDGERGKVDSTYRDMASLQKALDEIDVPTGTFYGKDESDDVVYSFRARTQISKASGRLDSEAFDALMSQVVRWANKEHGQMSTEWIKRNAPDYMALRHGVNAEWARSAVEQRWMKGDAGTMPDDDAEVVAAAVEAARRGAGGITRLKTSQYFTFDFEGEDLILSDELRAKVEAELGVPLVEKVFPGFEGEVALVPAEESAEGSDPLSGLRIGASKLQAAWDAGVAKAEEPSQRALYGFDALVKEALNNSSSLDASRLSRYLADELVNGQMSGYAFADAVKRINDIASKMAAQFADDQPPEPRRLPQTEQDYYKAAGAVTDAMDELTALANPMMALQDALYPAPDMTLSNAVKALRDRFEAARQEFFAMAESKAAGAAEKQDAEEQAQFSAFDRAALRMPTAPQLGFGKMNTIALFELDGEKGWTNGHIVDLSRPKLVNDGIVKYYVDETSQSLRQIGADKVEALINRMKSGATIKVEPIANWDSILIDNASMARAASRAASGNYKAAKAEQTKVPAVVLASADQVVGVPVDRRYLGYFDRLYKQPDYFTDSTGSTVIVKKAGKLVGIISPINADRNTVLRRAIKAADTAKAEEVMGPVAARAASVVDSLIDLGWELVPDSNPDQLTKGGATAAVVYEGETFKVVVSGAATGEFSEEESPAALAAKVDDLAAAGENGRTASIERISGGGWKVMRFEDGRQVSESTFDVESEAQTDRINWINGTGSLDLPLESQMSDLDRAATEGYEAAQRIGAMPGYVPDWTTDSDELMTAFKTGARRWLAEQERQADMAANTGDDAELTTTKAFLQSVIDGTADMLDTDFADRLTKVYDDYQSNAEVMGLFNQAAEAYSTFMVAEAQKALR